MAPDTEQQWPPRSPHEALLSTPKGRQRYREMLDQTPPSPSSNRSARHRGSPFERQIRADNEDSDDIDEDEETLQLKLQEIQTKLRLKKLQSAKAKDKVEGLGIRADPKLDNKTAVIGSSRSSSSLSFATDGALRQNTQENVQVPASPVRKLQTSQQTQSPTRVRLGIDKGLTAKDVSLKRAPNFRKTNGAGLSGRNFGNGKGSSSDGASKPDEIARPSSFNERLSMVRTEEAFRKERDAKIQSVRTNAFGIGRNEMESYKRNAVEIPEQLLSAPEFSRAEVVSGSKSISNGALPRSQTMPNLLETGNASIDTTSQDKDARKDDADQPSSFEAYSSFHLTRRILPHNVIARHVSKKTIFSVKDLLRKVKSPDYCLPDVEQDIVVFAILAKKSQPRAHKPTTSKNGAQTEERGKFMIMTLVDLDFEVDLFLFNSGFTRFWKLTEGTVIAILNPNIMPPPPGRQDTGRFSLVINSDEDTILEIGTARDLGSCQAMKKDGDLCGSWVNKKRTQFCEFHSNEAVKKQRSTRIEMNTSGFGQRAGQKHRKFGRDNDGKNEMNNYDWETKTRFYTSRTMSAADLIDGKDRNPADSKEKAEFLKRNMEAKEKERDMMKRLGQVGDAAGREYMQLAGSQSGTVPKAHESNQLPSDSNNDTKANTIDLSGNDRTFHLSPVKRKRPESSNMGSITKGSGNGPFGWGSNLREKLTNMKAGEKFRKQEEPPVRKKTRFVTEKGIREAGRESLGMELAERQIHPDDYDDDELVIV